MNYISQKVNVVDGKPITVYNKNINASPIAGRISLTGLDKTRVSNNGTEEILFSNSAGWYTAVPVGSDYYYLIKRMSDTHLSINIEAFVEFTPAQVKAAPLAFTRPK